MFSGNIMLMPGQELRLFDVLRPETRENGRGQELIGGYKSIGSVRGILAAAKPEEIERWRQLSHPVTHKIIMRHKPAFEVRPGDIFEAAAAPGSAGRRFYMQTVPYDPGGIGHYMIFYCDERNDAT